MDSVSISGQLGQSHNFAIYVRLLMNSNAHECCLFVTVDLLYLSHN